MVVYADDMVKGLKPTLHDRYHKQTYSVESSHTSPFSCHKGNISSYINASKKNSKLSALVSG